MQAGVGAAFFFVLAQPFETLTLLYDYIAPCRPESVLRKAVERLVGLLRERRVNYFYALDQFKVRICLKKPVGLWLIAECA